MELRVSKALAGTPKATITMSARVRGRLRQHYGTEVIPEFAVEVSGQADRCPRNLIVQKMKRDDRLLRREDVVRIGLIARKRLRVEAGDKVFVKPLVWERFYHGTKAPDPMVIKQSGWIVGSGAAYGAGVYLTTDVNTARVYGQTAIISGAVAWGEQLSWPLTAGPLKQELLLWCREHELDADQIMAVSNLQQVGDPRVENVLRWARLYGHYYNGGSGGAHKIRVFPGPIGSGYKPNRLRVIKVEQLDGTALWQRRRCPC